MAMSTKSPIFPIPQPHHFSDYGFDPQIDYFQVPLPHLTLLLFLTFPLYLSSNNLFPGAGRSEEAQERDPIDRRDPFQAAEARFEGRSEEVEEAEVVEKRPSILEMEVGGGRALAPPLPAKAS